MNTKNEKNVVNDKELNAVNGGFIPRSYDAESRILIVGPVVEKAESEETKGEKNGLIPIP